METMDFPAMTGAEVGRDFLMRRARDDLSNMKSAMVSFNNQNTIVMRMECGNRFVLLHDNRLFLFSNSKEHISERATSLSQSFDTADQDLDGNPRVWTSDRVFEWVKHLYEGEDGVLYAMGFKSLGINGKVLMNDVDEDVLVSDFKDMPLVHRKVLMWELQDLKRNAPASHTFSNRPTGSTAELPEATEFAMQLLLQFQTSPKYRILNTLYFSARATDSVLLLTIIVLTVIYHSKTGKWEVKMPEYHQLVVFAAVGIEIFSDIMHYTAKFWFLDRLSIYIGVGLYIMYYLIAYMTVEGNLFAKNNYIIWVLTLRFMAFVLEEMLDIAIDCEMHNDLILVCGQDCPPELLHYTDIRKAIAAQPFKPTKHFFIGSKSAWLPWPAFEERTYHRNVIHAYRFRWMYIVPGMFIVFPLLMLVLFAGPPILLFWFLWRILPGQCYNTRLDKVWSEMTQTY